MPRVPNSWQFMTNERAIQNCNENKMNSDNLARNKCINVFTNTKYTENIYKKEQRERKKKLENIGGKFVIKLHFGFCHLHWFTWRKKGIFFLAWKVAAWQVHNINPLHGIAWFGSASFYVAAAWVSASSTLILLLPLIYSYTPLQVQPRAYTHHRPFLNLNFLRFKFSGSRIYDIQELGDIL